jgi:hypothetical protein
MEWERILMGHKMWPHEASERGLIRPQMTIQIPWMGKLEEGRNSRRLAFP